MKNAWSSKWISSEQPRKQRKYRKNAPLHIKKKFLSVNLVPGLRERYGKRSMVIRKGDRVLVARGDLKGKTGAVERVDISREKVYIEGLKVKKVDGSEVQKPFRASNLQITDLKLDDKLRQAVIERSGSAVKDEAKNAKKAAMKEDKKEEKKAKTKKKGE
ncbi:MAG: 50S ribosomal protein L24 [Candidatus Aenigmarchaeota archaeon]|nr:50S ribosomal protein L24 [Candidatus Aenigmarchaeota archaeon]